MFSEISTESIWSKKNQDIQLNDSTEICNLLRAQYYCEKTSIHTFNWTSLIPVLTKCLKIKKFSYPQISNMVLEDVKLDIAIKKFVNETYKEIKNDENIELDVSEEKLRTDAVYTNMLEMEKKRAKDIIHDMRSKISDGLLRFTAFILYKLLPNFISGIITYANHINMLKSCIKRSPNTPFIYLPLHRSHLDYILVSFILINNDIRAPLVAAGNNLHIPLFGPLLRGLGAFFIRRKIDPVNGKKDIIYKTVLELYLQHALQVGHSIEFFIEGQRTRSGKPCLPKNGVLSLIVNAYMHGRIKDAFLVPISINYERLVDGSFVQEQLGHTKQPESFWTAIKSIYKVLRSKYGLIRIDFNKPVSLSELVKNFNENYDKIKFKPWPNSQMHHRDPTLSTGYDGVFYERQRIFIESISRHIVYDCIKATSVMATNAIAFLLLTRFREGVNENIFVNELTKFRKELEGYLDVGFTGDSANVVRYGCDVLGKQLILREKHQSHYFLKPNLEVPYITELAYYANSLVPHYIYISIVLMALRKLLKESSEGVFKVNLLKTCLEVCEILQYEFIMTKPLENLEHIFDDAIDSLCNKELIIVKNIEDFNRPPTRFVNCDEFDCETDLAEQSDKILILSRTNEVVYITFENILAPIGWAYYIVISSLEILLKNIMLERDFIKLCMEELRKSVSSKKNYYGESISTEYVKNCIKLLHNWNIIEISNEHGVSLISLEKTYNSTLDINSILLRIKNIIPCKYIVKFN